MLYQINQGVVVPFIQKFYKQMIVVVAALFIASMLAMTFSASAGSQMVWDQGFETDTDGWFDSTNGWSGFANRVASGDNGITSSEGSWHAVFEQDSSSAPFSRFDGYRDSWTPWTAEIDVYLDTSWALGEGFDYSVAATRQSGAHLRDYIFHVTQDTSEGSLLVSGSNNTNFNPREDLETQNHYVVEDSGWETLQHVFYEDGGALSADLNLLDSDGNVLFTETRTNPADLIATVVGGNRYAWFTNVDIVGGVAVDEHQLFLEAYVESKDGCKNGGWELGLENGTVFKNQGQCVSHFASNGTSTDARNKNR